MMKPFIYLRVFIPVLILLSPKLSVSQSITQKIALFDKVWGFIKYHHPAAATGNINWDSVYIAHINQAITAKNAIQLNRQIVLLIDAAGPVKKIAPSKIPNNIFKTNFDISWLADAKTLTSQNREKLRIIYKNRNQGNNRFIKYNNQSDFSGEKQYEEMSFPRAEYRQLFLARFWNIINYFAPYKYLSAESWDNTLIKFIPRLLKVNDVKTYYNTLFGLSKTLRDGHSSLTLNYRSDTFFNMFIGNMTMPFYCKVFNEKLVITKLVNDSLCKVAGVAKGDEIIFADNKPIKDWLQYRRNYITASNKTSGDAVLGWYALDDSLASVKLTIKRGGTNISLIVKRIPSKQKNWYNIVGYTGNGNGYEHINKSTLLIYASEITDQNLDTLRKMIIQSKAVIFDVRNYPGQDAFYNIMGIMLPEPKVINYSTLFMADNPGCFSWKPSYKIGDTNPNCYKGKTVILVDERSQSQGEYAAMVLQTIPGSVTIGSQTAGADGAVSYIPMGGKLAISYSGYGIYYTDKTPTQQVGVKIDIPVKKTIQSIINDQDVIKEEALKYLNLKGID